MKNSKKAKKENLTEPKKTKIKTMKNKSKKKAAEPSSPNVL